MSRKKTPEDIAAARVSKNIESAIRMERKSKTHVIKLLLLGARDFLHRASVSSSLLCDNDRSLSLPGYFLDFVRPVLNSL